MRENKIKTGEGERPNYKLSKPSEKKKRRLKKRISDVGKNIYTYIWCVCVACNVLFFAWEMLLILSLKEKNNKDTLESR